MGRPRHRVQTWASLAFAAFCILLGLLIVFVGWSDPELRYGGFALILFLGVGPLGFAGAPLLGGRGARPVLCERVETSVGSESAFVFPAPRARQRAQAVGSFGMAAGCAMFIPAGNPAVGIGCTIIFGPFFLFMLFLASRPLRLALTPTRLLYSSATKTAELPWTALDGCVLFETSRGAGAATDIVGVAATDPGATTWTRGRRMAVADRNVSGYEFTMPAEGFAADAEAVIDAIHTYRDDAGRRRSIGTEEELAQLRESLGATSAHP
jgi:hypothetical protein